MPFWKREETPKPAPVIEPEPVIPARLFIDVTLEPLLFCAIEGCGAYANPKNAVGSGLFYGGGTHKGWRVQYYLCDTHQKECRPPKKEKEQAKL